jgi:hypothetical protein
MVIIATHFLFNIKVMQQFSGDTAILNRDDFCGFQKVHCPLRDICKVADGGRNDI